MADRTTCPLCNKNLTYAGLNKHIFSSLHKNDLIVGLQKRKAFLVKDIKMFPITGCIPYIRVKTSNFLHLCFGCNKCYFTTTNPHKKHSCPKLAEGLKVVQSILDAPTLVLPTTQEPEPQATPLPSSKEVDDLKKQVADLKRENAKNKAYLEEEQEEKLDLIRTNEEALNLKACLIDLLTPIRDDDFQKYENMLYDYNKKYPGVAQMLVKEFGVEVPEEKWED